MVILFTGGVVGGLIDNCIIKLNKAEPEIILKNPDEEADLGDVCCGSWWASLLYKRHCVCSFYICI